MVDKLLIDARYNEEIRVAVVSDDGIIKSFEIERSKKKLIKGNIYLAKIARIEASLQAAFIDYGGDKHGFLPIAEISYDNFDQKAKQAVDEAEGTVPYKIQDMLHRDQIVLVQAIKEQRGNKCAAFSTFLSLPGKYCLLVTSLSGKPGGVSRKIDDANKERLRKIVSSLNIPEGLAVVIRSAAENSTKQEIKKDYEYLLRLWKEIKEKVDSSQVPMLIHEEGNILKRAIRDLYRRDTEKIIVQGKKAFEEARTFMKFFTPSHRKKIELVDNKVPLFYQYGVEQKIKKILDPVIFLPSGGSIVINTTEALTAIDVNSGKNKHEKNINNTALMTNLEAAEEIAHQVQLRDIAGLIVIDFIDMVDPNYNRKVEKKLKEALKTDPSNTQLGHIGQFGLLEFSRQRLRQSFMETNFVTCSHCQGTGKILSEEAVMMSILREIDNFLLTPNVKTVIVEVASGVDLSILNKKRQQLMDIERNHEVCIEIVRNPALNASECNFIIEEFKQAGDETMNQIPAPSIVTETTETPKPKKSHKRPRKKKEFQPAEEETTTQPPEQPAITGTTETQNPKKSHKIPHKKKEFQPAEEKTTTQSPEPPTVTETTETPKSKKPHKNQNEHLVVALETVEPNDTEEKSVAKQDKPRHRRRFWKKISDQESTK